MRNSKILAKIRAGHWKNSSMNGTTGLYEVLVPSSRLRELVRTGGRPAAIRDEAVRAGMTSLLEEGLRKAVLGDMLLEDALRATPIQR